MNDKFKSYIDSFMAKYGTGVIRSNIDGEPNDNYVTYEEAVVTGITNGSTFTAKLTYIPPGHKYSKKIGSTISYKLVYIGVPEMETSVDLPNYVNGQVTSTKTSVSAQPYAAESKAALVAVMPVGTVLSMVTVGYTTKGEYLVYAFTGSGEAEICLNESQLATGSGILIPTNFLLSSSYYNHNRKFIYEKVSQNTYTTPDIIAAYRTLMATAETNKVGLWSDSARPSLEQWIQDNKRYY